MLFRSKWNDDFRRGWLNDHKKEFLLAWADTGLKNPRLYLEGWMTQTYGLWSLIPGAYDVQSRFGWALTDENTKHMLPADNDRMAVGNFPMPSRLKSFLANFQYAGSQFLGAGFAFWLTILLSAAFYADRRSWCIRSTSAFTEYRDASCRNACGICLPLFLCLRMGAAGSFDPFVLKAGKGRVVNSHLSIQKRM